TAANIHAAAAGQGGDNGDFEPRSADETGRVLGRLPDYRDGNGLFQSRPDHASRTGEVEGCCRHPDRPSCADFPVVVGQGSCGWRRAGGGAAMTDLPFMKFFVNDWISDPCVRALTLAARGLWIEMLCQMWKGFEKGQSEGVSKGFGR